MKRMTAAVSVATVWTNPESPRPIDESALRHPALVSEWLDKMTVKDKVDLCNSNRIQTQILYGTEVLVAKAEGEWVQNYIPDQSTRKDVRGYPGWVPKPQLAESSPGHRQNPDNWAEVISPRASLEFMLSGHTLETSYLTRLPYVSETEEKVVVLTPHGEATLRKADVRLLTCAARSASETESAGQLIVEQAKRFIGLPYLWGGMSSYGYDCSGFVYSMHLYMGIMIPRDASDQSFQGQIIDRDDLLAGDLLFFAYEEGRGRIHHVGMYIGNGQMIHSPDSDRSIEIVNLDRYGLLKEHCISRRYWQ